MNTAAAKKQVVLSLTDRFGNIFERHERPPAETFPIGIPELDNSLHGFPRGAITEIHGATSSGRTTLLLSALAFATSQEEICAVIDCNDTFDPSSAMKSGVDCNRLLWIRCGDDLTLAFKSVDLLLNSGGFGLIVLNLCDVPAKLVRRVISSWWFRFRRAVENTPTVLVALTPLNCVRSCSSMALQLKNETTVWPSTLSLVSENHDGSFTNREANPTRHLALVNAPKTPRAEDCALSHTQFIDALQIYVNCERPFQWADRSIRFTARFH